MSIELSAKSDSTLALSVRDLYKYYPVITKPSDGLRYMLRAFVHGTDRAINKSKAVRAINGISFDLRAGERLGIIGRNGAGKSTLLEIIGGKLELSEGSVNVNGAVYTIASGNTGFDENVSAAKNSENYLRGQGLSGAELERSLKDIEDFVELGEFFYQPIKTYSLGMRVRAEFAAATSVSSEIISIDEVLGAGDIYWAEKCARRMENLCFNGSALLLVSHSLDQVLRYCDRTIWVENGRILMDGASDEVVKRYEVFLERMSWYSDDVDDKSASIDEVLPELGDVVLESSQNTVVRWPGKGGVQYSGIWINGKSDVEQVVERESPLSFDLEVEAVYAGSYNLRYCVTFWSLKGKRIAIFENDVDEVCLQEGDKHLINGEVPGAIVGFGEYVLTFSLFDMNSNKSSASEIDTRHDVVYKSFRISSFADAKMPVTGDYYSFEFESN